VETAGTLREHAPADTQRMAEAPERAGVVELALLTVAAVVDLRRLAHRLSIPESTGMATSRQKSAIRLHSRP